MTVTKNIWQLKADDVCLIDGRKCRINRDIFRRTKYGPRTPIREMICLENKSIIHRFIVGIDVEVIGCFDKNKDFMLTLTCKKAEKVKP